MGQEYITAYELPARLKCANCGSEHILIYGAKKVEYELERKEGKIVRESLTDIEWDIIYGVECKNCGEYADPDEIMEKFGYTKSNIVKEVTESNFGEGSVTEVRLRKKE